MQTCDVLVVGGGPAGSSLARRLRDAGLDVLVMDKRTFPRDKTCAGWITPQVAQTLEINADEYATQRTWQPITGFRSGVIGRREVEVRYERPVSFGIRRCEFDQYLLERSGARLQLGQAARRIERRDNRWVVNENIAAPLLIGAGGHFCPVARMLGARSLPGASVVVAQEIEFAPSEIEAREVNVAADTPELFFCKDLRGYGWCFRKGAYLNIGLGRLDPERLSAHVKAFCNFLRERGRVACDIPARLVGHAYQLYEHVRPKLVDDGLLLIGDAAGLAYPQSGEGIRPAIESGLMAADVILEAKEGYHAARLGGYDAAIRDRFGTPRGRGAADWLPPSISGALAGTLLSTRWFTRHVVIDRWFLHTHQPAMRHPLSAATNR